MLDWDVPLEEQGYTIDGDYLVGPSSWPQGAPPRFDGVLEAPVAKVGGARVSDPGSGGSSHTGVRPRSLPGGGAPVPRSEDQ